MRIVHAANLQFCKQGAAFWNQDQKIHHGLLELGHYVYTYSVNDMARQLGWFGKRDLGIKQANQALIKSCLNIEPDLLLLGHAQLISRETIATIKQHLPKLKVALWYVDALWIEDKVQHLHDRADLFDGLFCTTAGDSLTNISHGKCRSAFIPNGVHKDIENKQAFSQVQHEHDLIFIGSDRNDPQRQADLNSLKESLDDSIQFSLFGCLGNPSIFGKDKDSLMLHSKAALNLSRHSEMLLYSSSRVAEMMGNGLLTCTPRGAELEQLYSEDEMLYYSSTEELSERLVSLLKDDSWKDIAQAGWERNHRDYNAKKVAKFMLDFIYQDDAYKDVPWSNYTYLS